MEPKNEKEKIEFETAKRFISIYNNTFKTNYYVNNISDAPDIECIDIQADTKLYLEITLFQDLEGEIPFILGRKKEQPKSKITGTTVRQFEGDALPNLIDCINKKLVSDYGDNVALLIRQVSPIPWTYNIDLIRSKINLLNNPFDKGIWILTPDMRIIRLD